MFFYRSLVSGLGMYTIIALLLTSHLVVAATPPKYKSGQLKGSLHAEYYSTDSNYDKAGGGFEKLPGENTFSFMSARPELVYGLSNDWGISGAFKYTYGQSENSSAQRTNSSITDIDGSIYYKLYKKKFYLLPQLHISFPLTTFDPNQDNTIINEGALKVEVGSWIEKKFLAHRFYAYLAYAYQGDGRAHLLPWEIGAYNSLGRLLYGFSALGNEVITDDELIASPQARSNRTDSLNGGSKKFYSVNPTEINLKGWVGARIAKNFIVYLKYKKSINGSNSANGQSIMAEIKWRILNPYSKKSIEETSGFKIDGINQDEQKALDNLPEVPE